MTHIKTADCRETPGYLVPSAGPLHPRPRINQAYPSSPTLSPKRQPTTLSRRFLSTFFSYLTRHSTLRLLQHSPRRAHLLAIKERKKKYRLEAKGESMGRFSCRGFSKGYLFGSLTPLSLGFVIALIIWPWIETVARTDKRWAEVGRGGARGGVGGRLPRG